MRLIDTHCHIHGSDFGLDPETVIERARAAGVEKLICVGTDADDSLRAAKFAADHDDCWASVGLHPHEAKNASELEQIKSIADMPKVVAIGECGLDYFYQHSPKEDQISALNFQIELALTLNLPLIFHVREAFSDFWPIFDSYQGIRGVLHSFTAESEDLEQALSRGLSIGLNGIMTFTRQPAQLEMVKAIPLNNLVLETDAPFLTPVPHRGTINEPGRIGLTCVFLAKLRGEDPERLATVTSANAISLFGLK